MTKSLIIILGPTGIGKTDLSIEVAKTLNTEIISSDSRQIYKELCIGTAVPNSQQLHTVKHSFVQSHSIHEYYNASKYEVDVLAKLDVLFENHDQVILSGGSMLYIDVICNGIDDLPNIDLQVRNNLTQRFEQEGLENIRLELGKIDPEYYKIVDLKNHKRIIHALEIFYSTGKKYSSYRTNIKKERNFNIIKIGLNTDRNVLHERINTRVDLMIKEGLVEEARNVYKFKNLNSLNTVGYKELFEYFDGTISIEKAIELIKRNSRRYARRQITWFRKDENIQWYKPDEFSAIMKYIEKNI
ncbi:MAG: tRNA (adenosine(37)-N6)-dimethylallyltransferase MiaA [Prolixibacteraceae bacterium]|jgi:tRNA dimethylallyltransferase|nr:tRNA (adenosine(37)-N6)-dimethylallyltransferase MiaA [Prolixibacteraceae bacterium]